MALPPGNSMCARMNDLRTVNRTIYTTAKGQIFGDPYPSHAVFYVTLCIRSSSRPVEKYPLSGAAGLLGVVCDLLEIADLAPASGAGIAFLVPGRLFELAFPLLLIVRSSSGRSDARLVPVSVGGAG